MEISDKFEKSGSEPAEKENMIKFVNEYLHDRNGKNAAIRIGITALHADYVSKYFLEHPYVQNLIKSREAEMQFITTDKDAMRHEIIRNLLSILKKDDEFVKQSERIQAGKMLSELLDLNPKQVDTKSDTPVNVMIIPSPMSVDDWSSVAQAQQSKLQKDLEASLVS